MKLAISLPMQPTKFGDIALDPEFDRAIGHMAYLGYDAVELQIRDPDELDRAIVDRLRSEHGLPLCVIATGPSYQIDGLSLSSGDPDVRLAAIQRIESHIRLAESAGCMVMVGLMRGRLQHGVDRDLAWNWIVESHQSLARYADTRGVRIVVEPVNRYLDDFARTTQDGLHLLDDIGYDNVGLVLDTFHMNIEDANITDALREAGDRLFHVHISDSNRTHAGGGHIDFGAVLSTLTNVGYRGYLSGEFMAHPDAKTAARRNIETLRALSQVTA